MTTTAATVGRAAKADGKETKSADQNQSQVEPGTEPERGHANGRSRRRPEKVFRVGNCWGTVWCNEHKQKSGPNEQTTRIIRSVELERRFWNEKLKDGKGDYDSTSSFGLGDVHNLIAVAELAADYLRQVEADVTRDA
jgi:hypothetical protein